MALTNAEKSFGYFGVYFCAMLMALLGAFIGL
jgi:hypothetical protein